MLKQRFITALILIPVFLTLLIQLPPRGFYIFTGLIVLICGWEWSSLMGFKTFPKTIIFPFLLLFLMIDISFLISGHYLSTKPFFYVSSVGWCIALCLVQFYPRGRNVWANSKLLKGAIGLIVLIPCWLALNTIRILPNGLSYLFILFIFIWGADTGAYFVGKYFGKHKLLPLVSPGKTWEGFVGALLTTIVLTIGFIFSFKIPSSQWFAFLMLGLVTVLFSIVGDLFESMLKREAGLKDSSRLLPGHGGFLDRIDSLTSAAPTFILGIILLGH